MGPLYALKKLVVLKTLGSRVHILLDLPPVKGGLDPNGRDTGFELLVQLIYRCVFFILRYLLRLN